eukprot:TRINITY_DN5595_c0_g1_i1.p3 TRINITY_DN5595_c0_g1~~TRINITY_DN5595_c0_g1_i1.p3  ORF type:complete len:110 (-),score=15.72 TRINITY_DN5595_c0_g1_i1:2114-2443(-)
MAIVHAFLAQFDLAAAGKHVSELLAGVAWSLRNRRTKVDDMQRSNPHTQRIVGLNTVCNGQQLHGNAVSPKSIDRTNMLQELRLQSETVSYKASNGNPFRPGNLERMAA